MPFYSKKSLERLNSCHPDLITLFNTVIKYVDCTILEGHRGKEAQDKAYAEGKSKLRYPDGKHNKIPSLAVDVTPYPPNFNDMSRHYYFGGFVMGIAKMLYDQGRMEYQIKYGADWNMNGYINDEKFLDAVHYELIIP